MGIAARRGRIAVWALAIAGCAGVESPAPVARRAPQGADDLQAPAPSRGTMITGERVARAVHWPAAEALDLDLVATLDAELRAAVDHAPLPVLLPADVPLRGAKLMAGEHWYALWLSEDGLTVTLNASGQAKVYAHIRGGGKPHTVREQPALVTQNEAVWSASWVEHGVAYDLALECAEPAMSACTDDAKIRELAASLAYAGGRR